MNIPLKYLVVVDPEVHAARIVSGFVVGEFAEHEAALRAMKAMGLKPQPDVSPPAAAGDPR